jgi:HD superfamily phosphodiesterase
MTIAEMHGEKEYQTVLLAALLHDIGKLIQRGKFLHLDKGQHH